MSATFEQHAAPETDRAGARAWYALLVLIVATIFGFINRQIVVLVAEPLKHDLRLVDLQIGVIQGLGPALFALIAGVPLAWLADRSDRRWVLFWCVILWSLATAACGLAHDFDGLLAATVAIAIGEAALGPIVYSMIPDMFPGRSRLTANFIYFGAAVLGAGVGLALGGGAIAFIEGARASLPEVLRQTPAWRLAFGLVAAPVILIAPAIAFIGPVARQAPATTSIHAPADILSYAKAHWRTSLGAYLSGALYYFSFGAIFSWGPIAIMRDMHASPAAVGVGVGTAIISGSIAGLVMARVTSSWWRQVAGSAAPLRALSVMMALSVIPTAALPFAATTAHAFLLIGVVVALAIAGTAFSPAMLQDMSPPGLRAQVIAYSSIIYVCVGAASPVLVGFWSDHAGAQPHGLMTLIAVLAAPSFALAALGYFLTETPFRKTLKALGTG